MRRRTVRRALTLGGVSGVGVLLSGCILFTQPVDYEASSVEDTSAQYVQWADVNGDGTDEAIIGSSDLQTTQMRECGEGCLEPAVSLPVFGDLAAADFDGDGTDDLVIGDQATGVRVYFGSDGTTRPAGLSTADGLTIGGSDAQSVIAGDLTGDGFADIGFIGFAPGQGPVYRYVIVPGDGTGGFGPIQIMEGPFLVGMDDLAIGDVDGDGLLEGVVSETYYDVVHAGAPLVFVGVAVTAMPVSGETIQWWTSSIPTSLSWLAVGDIDGDGRDDVAFRADGAQTQIVALRSTQTGFSGFAPGTDRTALAPLGSVQDLALADVNGDGLADLLAVGQGDSANAGNLSWWRATSRGPVAGLRKDFTLGFSARNVDLGQGTGLLPELLIGHATGPHAAFSILENVSNG